MIHRYYFIFFLISFFISAISLGNIWHQQEPFLYSECIQQHNFQSDVSSDPLVINCNLKVLGKTILKKFLKTKDVSIQGKLNVKKTAQFKKNVTINGSLQFTQFNSPGILHNNAAGIASSSLIVNADVDPKAAIVDTKLATISTTGKVSNSATTATSLDTANTIVLRDTFGNFTTSMITLSGLVINPTDAATKAYVDASAPSSGSSDNIPNTLVLRDDFGGFSTTSISVADEVISNSLTITPFTVSGIVHNDSSGNLSSSLVVNADIDLAAAIADTKLATISTSGKIANSATTATSSNTANSIIMRDASGNFITTMISIMGAVTNPTDVATKAYVDAAVIPIVGTNLNIPNTLVQRDNTGSFDAQVISIADTVLTGNIYLGNSINSSMGNILKNGVSFIHNYGTNNTFIGNNAGNFTNTGIGRNSALGVNALSGIINGSNNIAIGYQAGQSLTTGSGNVYINANAATGNESSTIRIGTSQITCFIAGITGTGVSGDVVVVDVNGQLGITLSSERFKHDIQDMDAQSEDIYKLRPVTFAYNDDITNTRRYGLIAEEVDKVFPAIVAKDKNNTAYTVRYHLLPILLLNELQKQHLIIIEQQKAIDEMRQYESIIKELKNDLWNLKRDFQYHIAQTIAQ